MNFRDEQAIAAAIRRRDADALATAVARLPQYDQAYEDVEKTVEEVGGARYVNFGKIKLGTTIIRNRLGRAVVETATW